MDEHIPETPPASALIPAPTPAPMPLRPSGSRLSDSMLSMHEVRRLVHRALDELDQLGDRIANATGLR